MISLTATATAILPDDAETATLVGRVWLPAADGPSVVAVRDGGIYDVTRWFPTVSALAEEADPAAALRATEGEYLGDLDAIAANTPPDRRDTARPWLLAPIDLQVIKAARPCLAISMLERVIENARASNPAAAAAIRCGGRSSWSATISRAPAAGVGRKPCSSRRC